MKKHRRALKIGIIVACAVFLAFAALHSTPKAAIRTYLFTRSVPHLFFSHYSTTTTFPEKLDDLNALATEMEIDKVGADGILSDHNYPNIKEIYPGEKGNFYCEQIRGSIGAERYFAIKKVGFLNFAHKIT